MSDVGPSLVNIIVGTVTSLLYGAVVYFSLRQMVRLCKVSTKKNDKDSPKYMLLKQHGVVLLSGCLRLASLSLRF